MYRYVAGEQHVVEGELRVNPARQVAIDGFHVTSQKRRTKAISLAFHCVLYIVIERIYNLFSRLVNFSSSIYCISENTIADVSILLKVLKLHFAKNLV